MFAIFNPPHVKRGKSRFKRRKAKKFSFFTPGGGHIFARNKGSRGKFSFFNRRHSAASSPGGITMARGRRRGRHVRSNGLSFAAPRRSTSRYGLGSVLKPKELLRNITGATPILGGVILDGLFTKMVGSRIPYTGRGIGQIALGLAGAGLLKMAGSYSRMRGLGEGLFVGGVVGTLGCAFQNLMREGWRSALSLSWDGGGMDGLGYNDVWEQNQYSAGTLNGLGDFTSIPAVQRAQASESSMSQYGLPNSNAQYLPGAQMQAPQTPNQAQQARRMADYENEAIGALIGQGRDDMAGLA